jgi:hypothetical protein
MEETVYGNTQRSDRAAWGTGRVVFLANLPVIQDMLSAGWPVTAVYQGLQDSLAGVSYRQFTDYVRKHRRMVSKQSRNDPTATLPSASSTKSIVPATPGIQTKQPGAKPVFRGFEPGPKVPDLNELF